MSTPAAKAKSGPCCSWIDFIQPIRERWKSEWGELDEDHARIAWRRYSATSGEYLNAAEVAKLYEDEDEDYCPHGIERPGFCGECGHGG